MKNIVQENSLLLLSFSDMMCGRLYCVPASAVQPSAFGLRRRFGFTYGSSNCRMLGYDYGMGAMDPGLVPNGAKCDERKVGH